MHFRWARNEDYPQVARLKNQVHQLHSRAHPEVFKSLEEALSRDFFEKLVLEKKILIGEQDSGFLGYAFLNFIEIKNHPILQDRKSLFVEDLCIDETQRNRGGGKRFLQEISRLAQENQCGAVELHVWVFNDSALGFYRSQGLNELGIRMRMEL